MGVTDAPLCYTLPMIPEWFRDECALRDWVVIENGDSYAVRDLGDSFVWWSGERKYVDHVTVVGRAGVMGALSDTRRGFMVKRAPRKPPLPWAPGGWLAKACEARGWFCWLEKKMVCIRDTTAKDQWLTLAANKVSPLGQRSPKLLVKDLEHFAKVCLDSGYDLTRDDIDRLDRWDADLYERNKKVQGNFSNVPTELRGPSLEDLNLTHLSFRKAIEGHWEDSAFKAYCDSVSADVERREPRKLIVSAPNPPTHWPRHDHLDQDTVGRLLARGRPTHLPLNKEDGPCPCYLCKLARVGEWHISEARSRVTYGGEVAHALGYGLRTWLEGACTERDRS